MQVHLFDIDIPGGVTFKESDTLSAGKTGTVVDTDAGRLGIAICYDIRFPELAMLYAQRGAQLIVYPGEAFQHHCRLPEWLQECSKPALGFLNYCMCGRSLAVSRLRGSAFCRAPSGHLAR